MPQTHSPCPAEMEKSLGVKFVNKPQMLQFLIKEWSKKFHPEYIPELYYKDWKNIRCIKSSTELPEETLDDEISKHYYSLQYGVA